MATELEELIIRLTGDSEEYRRMLSQAIDETQRTAQEVRELGGRIESFRGNLESLASTATEAFAAIGLGGGLRDLLSTFSAQEDAEITLQAAIRSSNEAVESQFPILAEWASQMQQVTRIGDEVTLGLLQQAYSLGVTGTAAQRAVRNAIALAAAQGLSVQSTIRMTTGLEQGNTTMLARRLNLQNIADPMERVRVAQQRLNEMFEVELALTRTSSGQLAQLSNTWGDLKEVLGGVVAVGIGPTVRWMRLMVDGFHALDPEVKRGIATTVVFTMAVAGLATGLRVLSAVLLLVQRRMILLTAAAATVAFLIHRFGGLEEVMDSIERSINDALNIDPTLIPQLANDGFDAGNALGEEFTRGVMEGTEGVRGILFNSAESAAALAAYARGLMAPVSPGALTTSPAAMAAAAATTGPAEQEPPLVVGEDVWRFFMFDLPTALGYVADFFSETLPSFFQDIVFARWAHFFNVSLPAWAQDAWTDVGLFFRDTMEDWGNDFWSWWNGADMGAMRGAPRQHGGPVTAGHPYIVGEAGPELFIPGHSGNIVPAGVKHGGGSFANDETRQALMQIAAHLKAIRNKQTLFVEPVGLR